MSRRRSPGQRNKVGGYSRRSLKAWKHGYVIIGATRLRISVRLAQHMPRVANGNNDYVARLGKNTRRGRFFPDLSMMFMANHDMVCALLAGQMVSEFTLANFETVWSAS